MFEWLTPFALRGLKSLIVGVGGALDIERSELPNLEELACMNFEPKLLGPILDMHSLHRVWLFGPWSLETFDALTAGLEAGMELWGLICERCTSGRWNGIRKEHQDLQYQRRRGADG